MRPVLSVLALTVPILASCSQESEPQAQVPVVSSDSGSISSSSDEYICQHPPYKIQLVSSSPLVIYIKDFLTEGERKHLREVSKSSFRRSAVSHKSGSASSHRTSKSTYLRPDPVVECIESRALEFQGYDVQPSQLEPLQLVQYSTPDEHYHLHTDWFENKAYKLAINGGNRVSSFFAYVHVSNDTTGGGTHFPLVDAPRDERWCTDGVVDCDEPWDTGLTFRPAEGNAIYWENLYPDGSGVGNHRTVHAGLPLTSGEKIGMNIWTRQLPLSDEARATFEGGYPDV